MWCFGLISLKSFFIRSAPVDQASLVAQRGKRLPARRETQVRSLGWEIPGEGNDNPLQYSYLEKPMDGEAY